jgi:copper chaperone CopZ
MFDKTLRAGLMVAALATSAAVMADTMEVSLQGLNCALCSEAMKTQLKKLSGAQSVLPHLDCGVIFLDMPTGAKVDETRLGLALLSDGFTLKSVKPANMSLAQARDMTC